MFKMFDRAIESPYVVWCNGKPHGYQTLQGAYKAARRLSRGPYAATLETDYTADTYRHGVLESQINLSEHR